MNHFSVKKRLHRPGSISKRGAEVMRLFGLDRQDLKQNAIECTCNLKITPGQICLITGPSGAGKTILLRQLYRSVAAQDRIWLTDIPLDRTASVIDCIEGSVPEALRILCKAGLGDVFTILNRPGQLSEGQKYRYRMARAIISKKQFLFADEFGSALDRTATSVLAFQTRRTITERETIFFAASCREDLIPLLMPDVLIRKDLTGQIQVIYTKQKRKIC